jgi:hypothetical protein
MFAKLILPDGYFRSAKTIFAGTVFSMNRQKLANPAKTELKCYTF